MSTIKKFRKSLTMCALSLLLSSCSSSSIVRYPDDYQDKVFNNDALNGTDDSPVIGNDNKHYYDSVISSTSTTYSKTLTQILLEISKYAHNNDGTSGSDVTHVANDFNKKSVYAEGVPTGDYDNLLARAKDSMLDYATETDYMKDNLFYESKFVTTQLQNYALGPNFDDSKVNNGGILYTPTATFDELFSGDYSYYLEHNYYDNLRVQYLTADYIYNKSYASIGNSTARKVQIIALADRSDNTGAAKRLLTAYVKDYISDPNSELLGTDPDFTILSRLWRGITREFVSSLENGAYVDRYPNDVYLTDDEIKWLETNKLMNGTTSSEMSIGKLMSDKKKLDKMKYGTTDTEDPYSALDSSLESSYTDTYTHSADIGIRNSVDSTAGTDYISDGIYTSSSSLPDGFPTALKNSLFSVNLALDKDTVDKMKNKKDKDGNDAEDYVSIDGVSIFQADGNRYIINNGTVSSDDNQIIYYNSSNTTYYLVRVLDAVSNTALSTTSSTVSMYDTDAKKEQIAREVAFSLASSETYAKEAVIYYLRRTNIEYSDSDFLEYLKSNYKDLFKSESKYDDEPKIAFKAK